MVSGAGRKRRLSKCSTLAEFSHRLGPKPAWRIRTTPAPGLATAANVLRIQQNEHWTCELSDGILVE